MLPLLSSRHAMAVLNQQLEIAAYHQARVSAIAFPSNINGQLHIIRCLLDLGEAVRPYGGIVSAMIALLGVGLWPVQPFHHQICMQATLFVESPKIHSL